MQNRAFWKAFHSLIHPISISAVILLLLNDHVLRIYVPSWWTGKLGDFTWLIFAPMICALVVAWIVPKDWHRQPQIVGYLSFGFIGVWFATAKTLPAVQQLTNNALSLIVGYQTSLRLDTTDLFTIPALFIGWMVWRRALETQINLRPYGWAIILLGVLATVATSPSDIPTDRGITCLLTTDDIIYVINWDYYNGGVTSNPLASSDGGLTWNEENIPDAINEACRSSFPSRGNFSYENDNIMLRLSQDEYIQISVDEGNTWNTEFDLSPLYDQRRQVYFDQYHEFEPSSYIEYAPGPYHALFDDTSGNLILAMGYDGLLLRDADANWQWVSVGDHRYRPNSEISFDLSQQIDQLKEELLLSFSLFFLVFATVFRPYGTTSGCLVILTAWSLWFLAHIFVPADINRSFFDVTGLVVFLCIPIIIMTWLMIASGIEQWYSRENVKILLIGAGLSSVIALIYILPYVLWSRGIIVEEYSVGLTSALLSTIIFTYIATLFFQMRYARHLIRKRPPKRIDGRTQLRDLFYTDDETSNDDLL